MIFVLRFRCLGGSAFVQHQVESHPWRNSIRGGIPHEDRAKQPIGLTFDIWFNHGLFKPDKAVCGSSGGFLLDVARKNSKPCAKKVNVFNKCYKYLSINELI